MPSNTSPPTISGIAEVGRTLQGSNGSWQSSPAITFYTRHWGRCDAQGDGCVNIAGATNQTYTLTNADAGHALRLYVTANNADGYTTARSAPTAAVGGAPTNTSLPTISGVAAVGKTLTATTGSWKSVTTPTYGYQWGRCDSRGGGCGNIPGASSKSYAPVTADVGHTLLVYVTATTTAGSRTVHSSPTAVVVAEAVVPVSTRPPTISGKAQAGQTLSSSKGSWRAAAPITFYTYLWTRCDAQGRNCKNIAGATSSKYVVSSADVGARLLVYVTANTATGFATAHSALTATVAAGQGPKSIQAPVLTGRAEVGQTLTASPGGWSSSLPITSYTYLWARCDAQGRNCANISGATKSSYTVAAADAGSRLLAYVTANTAAGFTTTHSALTGVVAGAAAVGDIDLGNGVVSVPASAVALPDRLVIDRVAFSPNPVRSRHVPVVARFRVSDTQGHVVRGALVYMLGLPYGRITSVPEVATGLDGWATLQFEGTSRLPIVRGGAIVVFVRARTPQGNLLAGASTRRLVQLNVNR